MLDQRTRGDQGCFRWQSVFYRLELIESDTEGSPFTAARRATGSPGPPRRETEAVGEETEEEKSEREEGGGFGAQAAISDTQGG